MVGRGRPNGLVLNARSNGRLRSALRDLENDLVEATVISAQWKNASLMQVGARIDVTSVYWD